MKTAIVLSGGGAAGALEAGALHELYKHINPDMLIGASVGAINAGMLASGNSTQNIVDLWKTITRKKMFPFNTSFLYQWHKAASIFRNDGIQNFLQAHLKTPHFKDCQTDLHIAATELHSGKGRYFSSGKLAPALIASSSLPPFLPPYKIGNKHYIDGSLSNYIGTQKAMQEGAKQIIVINAKYAPKQHSVHNLLDLSQHAYKLLKFQAMKKELEMCKGVHLFELHSKHGPKVNITNFKHTEQLIQEGKSLARNIVGDLK